MTMGLWPSTQSLERLMVVLAVAGLISFGFVNRQDGPALYIAVTTQTFTLVPFGMYLHHNVSWGRAMDSLRQINSVLIGLLSIINIVVQTAEARIHPAYGVFFGVMLLLFVVANVMADAFLVISRSFRLIISLVIAIAIFGNAVRSYLEDPCPDSSFAITRWTGGRYSGNQLRRIVWSQMFIFHFNAIKAIVRDTRQEYVCFASVKIPKRPPFQATSSTPDTTMRSTLSITLPGITQERHSTHVAPTPLPSVLDKVRADAKEMNVGEWVLVSSSVSLLACFIIFDTASEHPLVMATLVILGALTFFSTVFVLWGDIDFDNVRILLRQLPVVTILFLAGVNLLLALIAPPPEENYPFHIINALFYMLAIGLIMFVDTARSLNYTLRLTLVMLMVVMLVYLTIDWMDRNPCTSDVVAEALDRQVSRVQLKRTIYITTFLTSINAWFTVLWDKNCELLAFAVAPLRKSEVGLPSGPTHYFTPHSTVAV